MQTARQATSRGIREYWEIVADAERVLDESGGECVPAYDALDALASDTVEYTCEQLKLAIEELDAKAEANEILEKKYQARKLAYRQQKNRLREQILHVLGHVGKDRVETESGKVAIRRNTRVEVDESNETMERLHTLCLATPTWSVDRQEIARILKKGEVSLPGCRLVLGDPWVDVR